MKIKCCLYCEKEIFGRSDKKYCNEYCKSAYNYEKNKTKLPSRFKVVDRQLKKNYRILKKYNQAGKSTVRKEKLLEEGFNPKYFTGYWRNRDNKVYWFCYDYGFMELTELGKPKFLLVQWQPYMEHDSRQEEF